MLFLFSYFDFNPDHIVFRDKSEERYVVIMM